MNGGAYGTIALPTPTATSVERTLTIGSTYRFRVRAKDRAGNISSFKSWPALTPTRLQESTSSATYTGAWSVATNSSASGGTSRYTSYASRKVVVRFMGRDVAWVATRTTSSGRADVRIDGVLVKTVQLDRASTAVPAARAQLAPPDPGLAYDRDPSARRRPGRFGRHRRPALIGTDLTHPGTRRTPTGSPRRGGVLRAAATLPLP